MTSLKSSIAKTVFIGLLAVLVLLPDLQMAFPFFHAQALDEKRLLAPFPDFVGKIFHGNGRLAVQINDWFDDRLGFRPWLVRLSHQIDYSLFSYSDKVYIGRDGWLYGKDLVDEEVTLDRTGSALDQKFHTFSLTLARFLSSKGIKLLVVSNPVKGTVYRDYLPPDAPRVPEQGAITSLIQFLESNKEWTYLNGREMLQHCRQHELFYRLDEHITVPAGFCIAVQVVNRIARDEGRPGPFWKPEFVFKKVPPIPNGGLVSFLSLLFPPEETYEVTDQAYRVDLPAIDGSFDRPAKTFYEHFYKPDPNRPFEWIYTANDRVKDSKLPPLLWYGNSFTDWYFGAGLQFQFSKVYRVRSTNVTLTEILTKIPLGTKYFLLQFLEPYMDNLIDTKVPQ